MEIALKHKLKLSDAGLPLLTILGLGLEVSLRHRSATFSRQMDTAMYLTLNNYHQTE